MDPSTVSNSYVVAAGPAEPAVIVDAGTPIEPLLEFVQEHQLQVRGILLTHEHTDHTAMLVSLQERFDVPVTTPLQVDSDWRLALGPLTIRGLATPGHVPDHISYLIDGHCVFTGDVLFAGSVGGTLGGGPDGYDQLRRSVMEVLMQLPHELTVHPGHTEPTTIGLEWERNPFIRLWRGADEPLDELVTVMGAAAQLLVLATDYDGGTKGLVRFADGAHAIVPGSRIER